MHRSLRQILGLAVAAEVLSNNDTGLVDKAAFVAHPVAIAAASMVGAEAGRRAYEARQAGVIETTGS